MNLDTETESELLPVGFIGWVGADTGYREISRALE